MKKIIKLFECLMATIKYAKIMKNTNISYVWNNNGDIVATPLYFFKFFFIILLEKFETKCDVNVIVKYNDGLWHHGALARDDKYNQKIKIPFDGIDGVCYKYKGIENDLGKFVNLDYKTIIPMVVKPRESILV